MKNKSIQPIVVNATALSSGGGLSILRQFIDNIPADFCARWLIFVSPDIEFVNSNPNIIIQPIEGVKGLAQRFIWDAYGLKKWLKVNNITPTACISLQNTSFRAGNKSTKHFIYYHQPIPFCKQRWNPFKKQERNLWFYKNIYPFFVKLFLKKRSQVYVQLDYIKQGFIKKFHLCSDNIKVFTPDVKLNTSSKPDITPTSDYINLFYPASSLFYKNHRVVAQAVSRCQTKVKFYTTTSVPALNCVNTVQLGLLQPAEVQWMYQHCDALVFPSYIETFGLPLIEAALTGLPIIAADLPYAHEVLAGYEGAHFVAHDNPKAWMEAITLLEKGKRHTPINLSERPGWKELFEDINNTIQTS